MRGVYRSTKMMSGGQCVMMDGICRTLQWCVMNWAMAKLCVQLGMLLLEGEVVQFGTTVYAAVAVKPNLLNEPMIVLQCLTVTVTMGMLQEWSVQLVSC